MLDDQSIVSNIFNLKGFTKENMRLLWDKSDPMNVHPYKKGLSMAKAMAVNVTEASWGDGEIAETVAFCRRLSGSS